MGDTWVIQGCDKSPRTGLAVRVWGSDLFLRKGLFGGHCIILSSGECKGKEH